MTRRPDPELSAIWLRMLPLFTDRKAAMMELVGRHGLTPPHGMTLGALSHGPLRMRDLADVLVCDASYVTAVVDRLEELELAERRPSTTDRRVKQIELTAKGRKVADQIRAVMTDPPAAFAEFTDDERAALRAMLERILPEPTFPPELFRSARS